LSQYNDLKCCNKFLEIWKALWIISNLQQKMERIATPPPQKKGGGGRPNNTSNSEKKHIKTEDTVDFQQSACVCNSFFTSTITNQEELFSTANAGQQSQKQWCVVLRKCL